MRETCACCGELAEELKECPSCGDLTCETCFAPMTYPATDPVTSCLPCDTRSTWDHADWPTTTILHVFVDGKTIIHLKETNDEKSRFRGYGSSFLAKLERRARIAAV